ncbi:Acetoin catabolism regulatory protein [Janthinobacterium lividum]|uniref:sigma-54-dependent Fis family transcriptional regulator n=1 Tax=Janthinobacterium lividum TaxID=29581 RepID=UPI000DFF6952|nr:Acetoin catabolism regulatory protein [Janthinobacterium lividum]
MPYVRQTSHIDRVRDLIAGRIVNPGADTARLASSYRRSLDDYRLDPASTTGPRILTGAELRAIQQSEEDFLRSTGQCLPRLHAMVREAGYCVILANARGVTIDYVVDTDQRKDFKKAGLYPGSCWSEEEEGTCGIASVLLDHEAITVHKTDHFRAAFTGLTCSAAPIFSPHGDLIGVLDASALRSPDARDSQRLVKQLVRQGATLIEDGFFLKSYSHCCILLAHRNRHFVEVQPEMLLAIDEHGDIVAANRCARDVIGASTACRVPSPRCWTCAPRGCSMRARDAVCCPCAWPAAARGCTRACARRCARPRRVRAPCARPPSRKTWWPTRRRNWPNARASPTP